MNITRDVITDLLPAYFSGEASADTRAIVEEFFANDPEFERRWQDAENRLAAPPLDPALEQTALKRAKRLLRIQTVLLALASTFTLNIVSLGFSFEVRDGHVTPHWLTLPGQLQAVLVIAALAIVSWAFYFRVRRRVRSRVL
jgi:anti-sigma factor RsiW